MLRLYGPHPRLTTTTGSAFAVALVSASSPDHRGPWALVQAGGPSRGCSSSNEGAVVAYSSARAEWPVTWLDEFVRGAMGMPMRSAVACPRYFFIGLWLWLSPACGTSSAKDDSGADSSTLGEAEAASGEGSEDSTESGQRSSAVDAVTSEAGGDDAESTETTGTTSEAELDTHASEAETSEAETSAAETTESGDVGHPWLPGECDIVNQDCTDGEHRKCAPLFGDELAATCLEVHGEQGVRASCKVMGSFGVDDCAVGLMCTAHENPTTEPRQRSCKSLCTSQADCPAEERCHSLTQNIYHQFGVCLRRCDPLASDCGKGLSCVATYEAMGSAPETSPVDVIGSCFAVNDAGEESAPCDSGFDCSVGLACDRISHEAPGICRRLCDEAHACEQPEQICQPLADSTLRICVQE